MNKKKSHLEAFLEKYIQEILVLMLDGIRNLDWGESVKFQNQQA
jgi:hypothetical protein